MRVLFVVSSMPIGGLELFTVRLADFITAKGIRVGIIVFKDDRNEALGNLNRKDVSVFFARRRHKLDFSFIANIREIIRTFKPHAILSLSDFAYFFSEIANRATGRRAAHFIELSSHGPLSAVEGVFARFFLFLSKLWGAYYIFISDAQAKLYHKAYRIPQKRSFLIPCGVDTAFFSPPQRRENKNFKIAHIAGIRPVKDQWTLLRTLKLLDNDLKNWQLLFAGSGSTTTLTAFKRYLRENDLIDRATFNRSHDSGGIKDTLARADVFVLTSLSEGLPNAALEAISMALPCILTNVGGCPEIVKDGHNGYLVEPKDYRTISDRLLRLHNDRALLKQMGANARETAVKRFDMKKCAEKHIEAFKKAGKAICTSV